MGLVNSLQRRGISRDVPHDDRPVPEQVLARLQAEADRSLKRELLLDAVADKLAVQVSDEEIDEPSASRPTRWARPDEIAQACARAKIWRRFGLTFAYGRRSPSGRRCAADSGRPR